MRLAVISNGFQVDFMLDYLDSLVGRVDRIDFIDSQIYDRKRIDPSINFHDMKGGGILDLSAGAKIKRVLYYYSHLIRFFIKKARRGIVHMQGLRFKYLDGIFHPADITALPYREASQSGVLFMSYVYGVPVIVSGIGGFPYDVRDGETGIIFRCNDSSNLKEKLENYINQSDYKNMLNRDQIREFARENYSWKKSGKEFIDFLNE